MLKLLFLPLCAGAFVGAPTPHLGGRVARAPAPALALEPLLDSSSAPAAELFARVTLLAELPAMRAMGAELALLAALALAIQGAFVLQASPKRSSFDAATRARAVQALEAAENDDAAQWERVTEDLSGFGRSSDAANGMYCLEVAREGRLEWVCV